MARIAGRLFSQQPFAWNCEEYANNRRRSAKMQMNALLIAQVECLRISKDRSMNMRKRDIESAMLVRDGILPTKKDVRTAFLKFCDSDRLRSANAERRAVFRLSFGGLRCDEIDVDLSYDSIFEPQANEKI